MFHNVLIVFVYSLDILTKLVEIKIFQETRQKASIEQRLNLSQLWEFSKHS